MRDVNLLLLEKIRKQPYVVLGKPSATLLGAFIAGYGYGLYEQTGLYGSVIPIAFQRKLADQYGGHALSAPSIVLKLCGGDEEAAFFKFYELLDEFLADSS